MYSTSWTVSEQMLLQEFSFMNYFPLNNRLNQLEVQQEVNKEKESVNSCHFLQ